MERPLASVVLPPEGRFDMWGARRGTECCGGVVELRNVVVCAGATVIEHRVRITGYQRVSCSDVTALLAERNVSIVATQASTDHRRSTASIDLEMEVASLSNLARLIDGMRRIPGVIDARRQRARD
jgi:uncharacterized protein with ACT and thioredoxin-like domain